MGFIGEFGGVHHGPQLGPQPIPFQISRKFPATLVDNVGISEGNIKLPSPLLQEQCLPEPEKPDIFIGEFGGLHHGPQLEPQPIPFQITQKFPTTLMDNVGIAEGDMKLPSPFQQEQ